MKKKLTSKGREQDEEEKKQKGNGTKRKGRDRIAGQKGKK